MKRVEVRVPLHGGAGQGTAGDGFAEGGERVRRLASPGERAGAVVERLRLEVPLDGSPVERGRGFRVLATRMCDLAEAEPGRGVVRIFRDQVPADPLRFEGAALVQMNPGVIVKTPWLFRGSFVRATVKTRKARAASTAPSPAAD